MCELTRLLVECVPQKDEDDAESNEGRPPSEQEHDDYTTNGAKQGQPFTIKPKGWTPTCGYTSTKFTGTPRTRPFTSHHSGQL